MKFKEAMRWLVKARDYAYLRRDEECHDTPLSKFQWKHVSLCVKQALKSNDASAAHLKIPLQEIDKNQMGLMYLSAQALVPFLESDRQAGMTCDSRVLDIFDMAINTFDTDERDKSPFQRRVFGVSFFVQEYKIRTAKNNTMVSLFTTTRKVSNFERTLYLSFVYQAVLKSTRTRSKYGFKRTKQDLCQRLGQMIVLIVDAFNLFAKTCNCDTVEAMISPYIIWKGYSFMYEPIQARSDGYSPTTQTYSLQSNLSPTENADLVDKAALDLSDDKDKAIRRVAAKFLEELKRCVLDDNLVAPKFTRSNFAGCAYFVKGNGDKLCSYLLSLRKDIRNEFPVPTATLQEWENLEPPGHDDSSHRQSTEPTTPEQDVFETPLPPPIAPPPSQSELQRSEQAGNSPGIQTLPLPEQSEYSQQHAAQSTSQFQNTEADSQEVAETTELDDVSMRDVTFPPQTATEVRRTRTTQGLRPTALTTDEKVVEKCMNRFVDTYNCSFTELLEKFDERHGTQQSQSQGPSHQRLRGNVQLLLTDPPYGIRAASEKHNSAYDTLTLSQMKEVVRLAGELLREGGHGIIYCSFQQLNAWRVLLSTPKRADGTNIFKVTQVPYNFLKSPGIHRTGILKKTTSLRPTGEIAVHFVKRGLSHDEQLALIDYDASAQVLSRFPGYSNTIDNIPELERGEQLRFNGRAVRNEQKSVIVTRHLVLKHSQPNDLVVDLFTGTGTTPVACITLPKGQHRRFVGCELSSMAYELAQRRIITSFSKLVVSKNIDIIEDERPSSSVLKGIVLPSLQGQRDEWNAPGGYPASTLLPSETIQFISRLLNDSSVLMHSSSIPSEWPIHLQERVLKIDPEVIRAYECMRDNVYIAKSTIRSSSAGKGLFAAKPLRRNSVIGYYYGLLVYENLLQRNSSTRAYGTRMSQVTKNGFEKFAIGLHIDPEKLSFPDGKEIFLVPSQYNAFRFVNDYRYLPDDEEKDSNESRRKPNIQFWQPDIIDQKGSLRSSNIIKVKVLDNIPMNAELFIDYGPDYVFPSLETKKNTKLAGGKRKRSQR